MTILNGYRHKITKKLGNLSIHAYTWHDCDSCPESNRMFATPGIKFRRPTGGYCIFVVYWPRKYVVISWDGGRYGECCG